MSAADKPPQAHAALEVETWVERDGQWLHRLLRRNLRLAPTEADDIVQETWLRVLRAPPRDIAHPRAFLSRIALNLFRDGRRRERLRREKQHLLAANDSVVTCPQGLHEQEADRLLEQVIGDLPEPLRDVFVLSRFRKMTNHDIARHLGISVKTVEWRIGKAVEQCMTKLLG
ncbi:MAG: sigma-70 family RNA polymerase sigma factor [Sphingobium sp.]|uniref:RNA polymerase sigma factor n=1 Tax=Sphingobium sp. CECT 9361 TaxID=2845384 RepID=UPI001E50C5EE|nr:sigma-70 family RNA polymerase sigma factor [Sphingobium sp. CECT 9361]CAH0356644.1 putative RNA polymerase sigma factor FecI [Sphingobium sp. CECT 9361]